MRTADRQRHCHRMEQFAEITGRCRLNLGWKLGQWWDNRCLIALVTEFILFIVRSEHRQFTQA